MPLPLLFEYAPSSTGTCATLVPLPTDHSDRAPAAVAAILFIAIVTLVAALVLPDSGSKTAAVVANAVIAAIGGAAARYLAGKPPAGGGVAHELAHLLKQAPDQGVT
jgi:hypothetical protein